MFLARRHVGRLGPVKGPLLVSTESHPASSGASLSQYRAPGGEGSFGGPRCSCCLASGCASRPGRGDPAPLQVLGPLRGRPVELRASFASSSPQRIRDYTDSRCRTPRL